MPEKIVRDSVHDVIAFRVERPADRLLFDLLNAAEFQRLRRIRQLGFASLAYPGADHSRYSHSLGVMETARKILDRLRRSFTIDEESETVCVVAALLHDLGHGPFSHVFERVSGIHHELLTQRVIGDPEGEVHRLLFQFDRLMPEKITDFLSCRPKRTFFCDILSSQLDADRLDYLLRDNLMTGSGYGNYDLNWLLHAMTIDTASDRLAVIPKGLSAVEAYLQARYHMYRNVYFHKVVRSAEGMVKLALHRAKRLAAQDRLPWPARDSVVHKALTGQRMTMAEFTELDDVSVLHCFKVWSATTGVDPELAALCRGLLFRKLYKSFDLTRLSHDEAAAVFARAREAIASAGGEASHDLFLDEPSDTPYRACEAIDQAPGNEILVLSPQGKLTPFGALSPMTSALNKQLMFRRLHVAPAWVPLVETTIRPANHPDVASGSRANPI
jgi:HD superfamily phosphohydrolase